MVGTLILLLLLGLWSLPMWLVKDSVDISSKAGAVI